MHPRLIKTVRSKGYLFVAEAAEALGDVEGTLAKPQSPLS
jgi:two-component system, OmpR family, response regulator RstA